MFWQFWFLSLCQANGVGSQVVQTNRFKLKIFRVFIFVPRSKSFLPRSIVTVTELIHAPHCCHLIFCNLFRYKWPYGRATVQLAKWLMSQSLSYVTSPPGYIRRFVVIRSNRLSLFLTMVRWKKMLQSMPRTGISVTLL